MRYWVITGGAATGKSAFCQALMRSLGDERFSHFSCDRAAHELWSDPGTINAIAAALEIPIDKLSRKAVRARVFAETSLRRRLEAVLHPPIFRMLAEARVMAQKAGKAKVFLAEVPLYYENQPSQPADTVIVVSASRIVQRTRLMEHRNLDADTCEGLLNAQLPLEVKTKQADVVVWNDGSQAILEAQALALLRGLWEP